MSMGINVKEVHRNGVRGLWICGHDLVGKPDVVVYYCHGVFKFYGI